MNSKKDKNISRRNFIKYGGLAGGALSIAGIAGAGFMAGKDYTSYTGWERYTHGKGQFFNRKPFEVEKPTYQKVGISRRINSVENIFKRNSMMYRQLYPGGNNQAWTREMGIDKLPEPLRSYYKENPGSLQEFFETIKNRKIQHENWERYSKKFFLADAFSTAQSAPIKTKNPFPPEPKGPPEVWDFRDRGKKYASFKSNSHASRLLKAITHNFGATLVGIAKMNPDWVYQGRLRGVGEVDFKMPAHWKYGIVFGVPHEWDQLYASPTYSTSYDGYSQLRQIAGKLDVFIRQLGYSSRTHIPPVFYDILTPPLAIDAGLGELGRMGVIVTPETGANIRLAAVTTDIPLQADKPIDIGITSFCKKCKICAEECPSGAISFADETENIRGYKKWKFNADKCYKIWNTIANSHPRGCKICLAVCPYTRKNNWIHNLAREINPRDPTGVFASGLLAMQKNFFEYPKAEDYLPPPDGDNANYHDGPDWLRTEEWFDLSTDTH